MTATCKKLKDRLVSEALNLHRICAGDISGGTEDISARIFRRQRRETEDISRTRVRAIVCRRHPLCDCAPGAHPQENLFGGRSGRMAEDQAAGMPPAAETTILALGAVDYSRYSRSARYRCSPNCIAPVFNPSGSWDQNVRECRFPH